MNTTFKTLIVILAAAFPAAFSAESLGVQLPTFIDSAHTFGAFVIALTVLTMISDYAPAKTLQACESTSVPAGQNRSHFRLAA